MKAALQAYCAAPACQNGHAAAGAQSASHRHVPSRTAPLVARSSCGRCATGAGRGLERRPRAPTCPLGGAPLHGAPRPTARCATARCTRAESALCGAPARRTRSQGLWHPPHGLGRGVAGLGFPTKAQTRLGGSSTQITFSPAGLGKTFFCLCTLFKWQIDYHINQPVKCLDTTTHRSGQLQTDCAAQDAQGASSGLRRKAPLQ